MTELSHWRMTYTWMPKNALRWRRNERDVLSNHQPHDCLLNRLFRPRKHQSSASLAFVRGIHRWPVNSPHKGPVTRKIFLFDGVIMAQSIITHHQVDAQNVPSIAMYITLYWTYGTIYGWARSQPMIKGDTYLSSSFIGNAHPKIENEH